jgi:hypothetical protein
MASGDSGFARRRPSWTRRLERNAHGDIVGLARVIHEMAALAAAVSPLAAWRAERHDA